jgi:hypothetical protein
MIWAAAFKFIKPFIPYLIAAAAVFFAYEYIKNIGYSEGKDDGYSKAIKELAKLDRKCPDLKCPKYEPCPPQIDYDKIKGRNITLNLVQNNTVEIDGDSLTIDKFSEVVKRHLENLEVVRTKRR